MQRMMSEPEYWREKAENSTRYRYKWKEELDGQTLRGYSYRRQKEGANQEQVIQEVIARLLRRMDKVPTWLVERIKVGVSAAFSEVKFVEMSGRVMR